MVVTPQMWNIKKAIEALEWRHKCDPNDYMVEFQLSELKIKLDKLGRVEKLGLKVVLGGKSDRTSYGRLSGS